MIWLGVDVTFNTWVQNRKPSGTIHLEKMLHGGQEGILTPTSLPQCCKPAYSMSSMNLFNMWPSSLGRSLLPWGICSLRYFCNNSFSKWSLQKLISHMEELIQQARYILSGCPWSWQPNTQEQICSSTTIKPHMLSIRLLGKSTLHLTHTPQSEPCSLFKKVPTQGFPGGTVVKNPPANAGDADSSPGLGRSHVLRSN